MGFACVYFGEAPSKRAGGMACTDNGEERGCRSFFFVAAGGLVGWGGKQVLTRTRDMAGVDTFVKTETRKVCVSNGKRKKSKMPSGLGSELVSCVDVSVGKMGMGLGEKGESEEEAGVQQRKNKARRGNWTWISIWVCFCAHFRVWSRNQFVDLSRSLDAFGHGLGHISYM